MKQFGTCRLDTSNQCLWRDGVLLNVPPKPYAVLRYLVEHPDRLITHTELMEALWPETYVQQQVLRTYVLELRRLLGDDASDPKFIATVPKRGYRFLAAVSEVSSPQIRSKDPDEIEQTPAGDLVGRQEELKKLESLMRRACTGERQIVFLIGEPGIGKTALLDAFCTSGCGDARVARGQSMERFGNREPYYPVKEQLSELCGSDKGEKTARLLARIAPGWYASLSLRAAETKPPPAVPTNAAVPTAGSRATAPSEAMPNTAASERTLGEICEALEAIAQETALLLAFEDSHWADDATIDLISALARRRTPAKLMIIAICRPGNHRAADHKSDDRNGRPPSLRTLKQDLAMRRLCTVIEVGPLKRDAVAEYLAGELRRRHPEADRESINNSSRKAAAVPQGLTAVLYQHSNGNPLFLSAILDQLIADRILRAGPEGWSLRVPAPELEIGVPENIREMIELEVEALSAPEQRLAEAASVIGTVFPVWAAAAVLAADAAEVEERYEDLTRSTHFVHPAGHDELPDGTRSTSYVFTHGFYREVLYRRQPEVRRSRGHQRLAESLGRLFAGNEQSVASEIAAHYEAAGNWMRAAESLSKIAADAAKRGRRDDAAKLLDRAIEFLGNLGEHEREPFEAKLTERLKALARPARTAPRSSSAKPKARRSSPAKPVSRRN